MRKPTKIATPEELAKIYATPGKQSREEALRSILVQNGKIPPRKIMKATKAPDNTAALNNLRAEGFDVKITHFRRLFDWRKSSLTGKIEKSIVPDRVWRQDNYLITFDLDHFGGATEIHLVRGEEKITVRADCYHKDRFCRRLGVKAALDKLAKIRAHE